MTTEKPQNFFQMLTKNWFLVLFIGSVIVAWTTMSLRIDASANELDAINKRVEANEQKSESSSLQLSAQLSQIQTDLNWIRERLRSLNN